MALYTCAHCGQTCGDYAGGYGGVNYGDLRGTIPLCHPNEPGRPDCYRRVSVWRENLGALRDVDPKPAGVEGISSETDAFLKLVALTEEMGLYGDERRDG